MATRKVSFWCNHCIDRSLVGWWLKNDTPAKCDGVEAKTKGAIVTVPPKSCEMRAEWVLVRDVGHD